MRNPLQLPRGRRPNNLIPQPNIHIPRPLPLKLRSNHPLPNPLPAQPLATNLLPGTTQIQHRSEPIQPLPDPILLDLAILALPQRNRRDARLGETHLRLPAVTPRLGDKLQRPLALSLQGGGIRYGRARGRDGRGEERRQHEREEELRREQDNAVLSRKVDPLVRREEPRGRVLDAAVVRGVRDHDLVFFCEAGRGRRAPAVGGGAALGRRHGAQGQEVDVHLRCEAFGHVGGCHPAGEGDEAGDVGFGAPFFEQGVEGDFAAVDGLPALFALFVAQAGQELAGLLALG